LDTTFKLNALFPQPRYRSLQPKEGLEKVVRKPARKEVEGSRRKSSRISGVEEESSTERDPTPPKPKDRLKRKVQLEKLCYYIKYKYSILFSF